MKTFKLTEEIEAVCDSESTRYGFRHLVTILRNGEEIGNGKCCYYNRTWESYEFQSALYDAVRKTKSLTEEERKACEEFIKSPDRSKEVLQGLKTVGMVASLGNLFCEGKEEKNKWKERMLKAGLEGKGFTLPDNWDSLTEEQKEDRLDSAIKVINK